MLPSTASINGNGKRPKKKRKKVRINEENVSDLNISSFLETSLDCDPKKTFATSRRIYIAVMVAPITDNIPTTG